MKRAGSTGAGASADGHSPVRLPLPARQRRRDSSDASRRCRHGRGPASCASSPGRREGAAGGRAYGDSRSPSSPARAGLCPVSPAPHIPAEGSGTARPPPQLLRGPRPCPAAASLGRASAATPGPSPRQPSPPKRPPHWLPLTYRPAAILPEGRGERAGAVEEVPAAGAARMREGGSSPAPLPLAHTCRGGRARRGRGGAAGTGSPPPPRPPVASVASRRRRGPGSGPFLARRPGAGRRCADRAKSPGGESPKQCSSACSRAEVLPCRGVWPGSTAESNVLSRVGEAGQKRHSPWQKAVCPRAANCGSWRKRWDVPPSLLCVFIGTLTQQSARHFPFTEDTFFPVSPCLSMRSVSFNINGSASQRERSVSPVSPSQGGLSHALGWQTSFGGQAPTVRMGCTPQPVVTEFHR